MNLLKSLTRNYAALAVVWLLSITVFCAGAFGLVHTFYVELAR